MMRREGAGGIVTVIIGLCITITCMLGGFMAMGGHVGVIWQPWEYVIICGAALGTFVVGNPMATVKDTGRALIEGFRYATPSDREYLDLLGTLNALMRALRSKPRSEVEAHIEEPANSSLFQKFPTVAANPGLVTFICDYVRLIIMGNVRTYEIETLMDEEIQTARADTLKPYHAMVTISEALPALGIVAAVLGVIKAMGALDQPPEVLGSLIGAALVGTFAGIFISYAVLSPIATKVKLVREKRMRLYVVAKQTLLAFMNGAMPHVALEHGRKAISAYERPSIDAVEQATMGDQAGSIKEAA